MRLLRQIGQLKREDDKAKEHEKEKEKENSKEKLLVGSRWSGSSRRTSPIGDEEDRLKVRPARNRPTSLVLSPSGGARATRGFWDSTRSTKDERLVVSEGEPSHKPDITKAKQFFNQPQPQSQPTPTINIETGTKNDPTEAGSTPIPSFPPSPSFRCEKTDKEKERDVESVTNSQGATSPVHAKERHNKGRKPAPRYSSSETGTVPPEERSHRSLSRLYMGGGSQRKSKVPPSPGTTSTENEARGFNIPNRSPVIATQNLSNNRDHSAPAISPVTHRDLRHVTRLSKRRLKSLGYGQFSYQSITDS
ncbi:hypothetical protein RSOLAG22IIIB_05785 [Rhizoctonia solani]|uniref:Uncharacterized protein n=1 Tax=Rhizoctonia solani TaxID=456999 RepID=A0A0K6G9R0_9AGAM|nr:hypothetical protein RSOLAG22IIIB_05785 [Rhizoctonia solani]